MVFNGPITVELDGSAFDKSGDYILFKYESFPGGPNGPQWDLDNYLMPNITIINEPTKRSGVDFLLNEPAYKRVIMRLGSNKENGCQYVEGDLNFTGPPKIVLTANLYSTPGNYKLFIVTGSVTGESFINGQVQLSGSTLRQTSPVYKTVADGLTTVWLPLGEG